MSKRLKDKVRVLEQKHRVIAKNLLDAIKISFLSIFQAIIRAGQSQQYLSKAVSKYCHLSGAQDVVVSHCTALQSITNRYN